MNSSSSPSSASVSASATELQLEYVNCPLCGGKDHTQHLVGQDLQYPIAGDFVLVRCRECEHVFMNPQPTAATIGACYPDDYGPHRGAANAGKDVADSADADASSKNDANSADVSETAQPWYLSGFVRRIPGLRSLYYWLTETRAHVVPPLGTGNAANEKTDGNDVPHVLEIGCAHGQFLKLAAERGWDVTGVEPADGAAAAARASGFDVRTGTIHSANFEDDQFDAAFAWMVIEHLPDPRETLQELRRVLKPRGWLAFSVPNFGCWEPKVFGKHWDAYELPRHLQHFTRGSIVRLLNETGFEVQSLKCQNNLLNVVGSLGFKLRARWPNSRLARRLIQFPHNPGLAGQLLLAPFARFLAAIGQGGRLTILARVKEPDC